MFRIIFPVAMSALCVAGWAAAHSGVKNPSVLARMEAMKVTQDNTKILGAMAKGERTFDAATARPAASEIARLAAETPGLFEAEETDATSEALPAIWDRFDDFKEKSVALEKAALVMSAGLETKADLREGLGRIGAACKACHELYRKWNCAPFRDVEAALM